MSAELIFQLGRNTLNAYGRIVDASCEVRSLSNGRRGLNEVVYNIREDGAQGVPYDPRPLPAGMWILGRPKEHDDEYMAPWFVPINCRQRVEQWVVVKRGGEWWYDHASGVMVWDYGYGLHHSISKTTFGCIMIEDKAEIERIVDYRMDAIHNGRDQFIQVLEATA